MRLKLKTAPLIDPVSLSEAKNHLKVDSADDDTLITALITTARQLAERETKRVFITQQWEMTLDSASAEIEIPKPPLISVVSIKVIKTDGSESVVDSTKYDIDASENSPGRIKLRSGCSWPSHRGFASFIVTFDAGYGDTAEEVPEVIKQAILQIIGHLYDNRGSEELPEGINALLFPYRILSL